MNIPTTRRSCAVNVVVAIDQNLLLRGDGFADPLHGHIHILHQERIVEVIQARTEERARLLESLDSPLDKKVGENPVYAQLGGKPSHLLWISRLFQYPFALFSHNRQRYGFNFRM